jgi:hypothetical protein
MKVLVSENMNNKQNPVTNIKYMLISDKETTQANRESITEISQWHNCCYSASESAQSLENKMHKL